MSKAEQPFSIQGYPEFRFALVLESRSVEAHSLIDSDDNKNNLKIKLVNMIEREETMEKYMIDAIARWREKHK